MNLTRIALALGELGYRSTAFERSRVVFACRRTQYAYWRSMVPRNKRCRCAPGRQVTCGCALRAAMEH
jgi:hypothetical protein